MDLSTTEHLVPFLRKLADAIECKEVVPQQLQRIGDFFMSYKFQEQALKDCEADNNPFPSLSPNPQELTKFLFMGWYIYQLLLRSETLNVENNE